jgi:phospholipid/cholesterol/gamma-HCH transport system substrate-binding protein
MSTAGTVLKIDPKMGMMLITPAISASTGQYFRPNITKPIADSTNRLVNQEGKPAMEDLRKTMAAAERAANNLDAIMTDARPGIQNFSKNTLPEASRLVRDLRQLSESLRALTERVEQGGIGSALGPEKLPDYKPRNGK